MCIYVHNNPLVVKYLSSNLGSSRVPGDEEEDGVDDLDNEFNFVQANDQDSHY